eukprot:7937123-Pyramimonas_sp.AAC.1
MLTYEDCMMIIKNIASVLSEDDRALLDSDRTERLNSGRVMFGNMKMAVKGGVGADIIWRWKKYLDQ